MAKKKRRHTDYTSIQISKPFKERIRKRKRPNESYEDYLYRALGGL